MCRAGTIQSAHLFQVLNFHWNTIGTILHSSLLILFKSVILNSLFCNILYVMLVFSRLLVVVLYIIPVDYKKLNAPVSATCPLSVRCMLIVFSLIVSWLYIKSRVNTILYSSTKEWVRKVVFRPFEVFSFVTESTCWPLKNMLTAIHTCVSALDYLLCMASVLVYTVFNQLLFCTALYSTTLPVTKADCHLF